MGGYDVIYTSYIDTPKGYAYLRAVAEKYGVKLVMDIDDNVFEVDNMSPAYLRFAPGSEHLDNITKIIKDVDVLSVSTPHLMEVCKRYRDKPIFLAPNYIDPKIYCFKPSEHPKKGSDIVIGYQGSSTHYSDLMRTGVMYALRNVMNKYPNVRAQFVGCLIDEIYKFLPKDRVDFVGGVADHVKWRDLWASLNFDIGIAPLVNSSFNMAKSDIKYQEYALLHTPAVYSAVEPYNMSVKYNETGFLATDELEWEEYLSWLVENPKLRKIMGNNAYKDVMKNETITNKWKIWQNIIEA